MEMALSIPNPQFNWGGLLSPDLSGAKTDGNESANKNIVRACLGAETD